MAQVSPGGGASGVSSTASQGEQGGGIPKSQAEERNTRTQEPRTWLVCVLQRGIVQNLLPLCTSIFPKHTVGAQILAGWW